MTLLTPIPAAFAAALTIPAVIVLYLLKLRRWPVRVSSTLLWEQAARDLQVNVPFRILRPSLFLLLHLLILGLFLLAMGRPALGVEGGAPARIVLLVDRSASMSAASGSRTRLADALDRAAEFADASLRGGGAEVAVVSLAAEPRVVQGFTRSASVVRRALEAIEVADQPGDLQAALRLAGALAAGTSTDEAARAVGSLAALFSDGGFEDSAYTLAGAKFRFVRVGPAVSTGIDNLGIVGISARRDYEDPGLVRVLARVVSAGDSDLAVPVALSVAGVEAERRVLEVPNRAGRGAAATFAVRGTGRLLLTVALEREDALRADNTASVVVEPAAAPRILLVVPDPGPGDPAVGEGPEWLLGDVLRELRPRSLRTVTRSAFEEQGAAGADLVVFDRVGPREAPPVPSISFGAGVPGAVSVSAAPGGRGTYVITWARSHPILRQVAMDTVYVSRPRTVAPAETAGATELAQGADGPLIVLVEQGRTRRVVVGFELADSNWPLTAGFPGFMAQAVEYVAGRSDGSAGCARTTEVAEVEVPPGTRRVTVTGPRDFGVEVPPGERRVALGVLDRVGVYAARPDTGDAVPVAVNLMDEGESSLRTSDALRVGGESAAAGSADDGPREVWHWPVIAALVLLTLEWFLYAWQMRA